MMLRPRLDLALRRALERGVAHGWRRTHDERLPSAQERDILVDECVTAIYDEFDTEDE